MLKINEFHLNCEVFSKEVQKLDFNSIEIFLLKKEKKFKRLQINVRNFLINCGHDDGLPLDCC